MHPNNAAAEKMPSDMARERKSADPPPGAPKILFVTPQATYLPESLGEPSRYIYAKGGGIADVSATLISGLSEQGANIHVAMPDYRRIFQAKQGAVERRELGDPLMRMPANRIHLARDSSTSDLDQITYGGGSQNLRIALNFQREVINNIIPRVHPDLIHCHDWMTGLIPALSRKLGIPCLFTFHNIHTEKCLLAHIEDIGIDAAMFWQILFYEHYPRNYEDCRAANPVDLLGSGVLAAHLVNTVSSTFLKELLSGCYNRLNSHLQRQLNERGDSVSAILNTPDVSFNPLTDKALFRRYGAGDHYPAKQYNKLFLQEKLGLTVDSGAPVFFWASRLDSLQKGCELLAGILCELVCKHRKEDLQIVFVAEGDFKPPLREMVAFHRLERQVSVNDFDENLSRLAYAASDFILIPSLFEPCGLPQMIGQLYGSLPIAYDTGGLHDTVRHLDVQNDCGNGFLFQHHDAGGLLWGIEEGLRFYGLSADEKRRQIERVMVQSKAAFDPLLMTSQYIQLYQKMLGRPIFG